MVACRTNSLGDWTATSIEPTKSYRASPGDVDSTLDEYANMDDGNGHAIFRIEKPSDPLNAAQKETPANIICRLQQTTPKGEPQ